MIARHGKGKSHAIESHDWFTGYYEFLCWSELKKIHHGYRAIDLTDAETIECRRCLSILAKQQAEEKAK